MDSLDIIKPPKKRNHTPPSKDIQQFYNYKASGQVEKAYALVLKSKRRRKK